MKMVKVYNDSETVAKRMLYLAWKACGGPTGMGFLQNNPSASEEDVWKNAVTRGDYPGVSELERGEVNADYVFGRMMKLRFKYEGEFVIVPEDTPRMNYQSWCGTYNTYEDLIREADRQLSEEK